MLVITRNKTIACLNEAKKCHDEGKHAIAMLHFNAACVHARDEMPLKAQAIRACVDRYRLQHFPRRSYAQPRRLS